MMVLVLLISLLVNSGMHGIRAVPPYHVINPISSGGMHNAQV
jgi:hypothetical protein